MSLSSMSVPRPDPEPKEPWRFEGAVDHAPALRRLKAPVDRGQLQRCLPLPTFTTTCHACAGERTALSCRPRRSRRPSAPWSGGGDLSAGSSHRSVQTCAYHLNPAPRLYPQDPDVTPKVRSGPIADRGFLRWRGDWRGLVRRALHAPHLRVCAFPRTPELALA